MPSVVQLSLDGADKGACNEIMVKYNEMTQCCKYGIREQGLLISAKIQGCKIQDTGYRVKDTGFRSALKAGLRVSDELESLLGLHHSKGAIRWEWACYHVAERHFLTLWNPSPPDLVNAPVMKQAGGLIYVSIIDGNHRSRFHSEILIKYSMMMLFIDRVSNSIPKSVQAHPLCCSPRALSCLTLKLFYIENGSRVLRIDPSPCVQVSCRYPSTFRTSAEVFVSRFEVLGPIPGLFTGHRGTIQMPTIFQLRNGR